MELRMNNSQKIVLFDGVCNLCNGAVQFILKRDKENKFLFGSLQGHTGRAYLNKYKFPSDTYNSFILIEGERVYTRSTAALRVLKHLGGAWGMLYAFIIIPRFIRDSIYNIIARNRYKWFGKKDECPLPSPETKSKFLE